MNKRVLLLFLFVSTLPAKADTFWVSPEGNDANPGTESKPFATLKQAQHESRQSIKAGAPVTVILRKGTYYLGEPLVFAPLDSGTDKAPITYKPFENEVAVISGGVKLNLKWVPYKNGIFRAKVPAGMSTDQLFVNGTRQVMARYPNFDPNERIYNGFAQDAISPQRSNNWADPRGGFIHAMHSAEWGGFHFLITGKKEDGTVAYEGGWQNNRPAGMHSRFRFVENIFEELDSPGEWFLDKNSDNLFFYPPVGMDLSKATIEVVRLKHLVEFRGNSKTPVKSVHFQGLTFRHASRTFMENKEPLLRSDWTTYRGGAIHYFGTEDCSLEDCFVDQVGGNAVFVDSYNRRLRIRGCHIARAGGNGVAFVGDRDAARVPRTWNDRSQSMAQLDRNPGPKSDNYPADCLVDDCLIYQTGRVEKQTAPVQIELSQNITVRHCSLYDVPRAGINIGDGCWGGHLIEFCDIFDTVKETGDHGSFNSWGRDRFWDLPGLNLNEDKVWEKESKLPLLDAIRTTTLRNNRWRCDHGWDIDLDDGSSNYHLVNNLCLNGGIKLREGFFRVVENNIMVNNGFHPHVWYKHSQDIVRRNIMMTDHYLPAGGMPSTPWGKEMNHNLVHKAGLASRPADKLAKESQRDEQSIETDAEFLNPEKGDFRVKEGSPALKLGFVNFPMDQFGVKKPSLKALARTPDLQKPQPQVRTRTPDQPIAKRAHYIWQSLARDISGLGDRSAYGLPDETGVLLLRVPEGTAAARAGFQKEDVIQGCNNKKVKNLASLREIQDASAGKPLKVSIIRKQQPMMIEIVDFAFCFQEISDSGMFGTVSLSPRESVLPFEVKSFPATVNDRIEVLKDGKLTSSYGPVFSNGTRNGIYQADLGASQSIQQIKTFSYNQNLNRGRQRFVLYGSNSPTDPGVDVTDEKRFTPIIDIDTPGISHSAFVGTSIRQSDSKPLGPFRWLVWEVTPATSTAEGENTAYQELQILK